MKKLSLLQIDNCYEDYSAGSSLDKIMKEIVHQYEESTRNNPFLSAQDIQNYEKIKDRLYMQVVNPKWNQKYLEHKYYVPFLDLAIVFYVDTVAEFKSMNPADVVQYIEGEPHIGSVPVDAGATNIETQEKVIGLNTENSEINEGMIRFDIIFYVQMKDGLSQIIVNVEAQKAEPSSYDILNRAIFYVSRMISSQKGRDFVKSNYNDIKRVYSIWICMNVDEHSMSHIHLTRDDIIGSHNWKGDIDLLNIVLLGLAEDLPEKTEEYELHRLLGALLSSKLKVDEKLDIIGNEFQIPLESDIRKDVSEMCNLSQGIEDRAFERGTANGISIGKKEGVAEVVLKLIKKGVSIEQVSDMLDMDIKDVQMIVIYKSDSHK